MRLWAALSLALAPIASAQAACVPPADAQALLTVLAPPAIRAVARACGAGTDYSFAGQMAARLQPAADAAWPQARAAVSAMGGQDLPPDLPDAALRPLVDAIAQGVVAKQVKAGDCGKVAMVLRPLASLPPDRFGELLLGLVMLAPSDRLGGIDICQPRKPQ